MTLHDDHPLTTQEPGADATRNLDVLVIGAGQTGLTAGYYLRQAGLRFLIVDSADQVGSAWAQRWGSLVLFTPRRYNAMPGLPFDGDPDREATRDEVIEYLHRYATELELPVQLNSPVTSLELRDGRYAAELPGRTIVADQVIIATGPFQKPRIPSFASSVADDVYQAHSTGYQRPSDVPPGRAVVVGGGNTGYQIAEELAADHKVVLAVGSRQTPLPLRIFGRQIFWWLTKLGILSASVESRLGKRLSQRETLIGSNPRKAKRRGIELRPRAIDVSGRTVRFADGAQLDADAIIWATGYHPDYSWLTLPVVDADGRVRHRRGVTDQPGLYFLGLTWQHTRGSALLGFVSDDAQFVAQRIDAFARSRATSPAQLASEAGSQ
jgi:putative flavoprotein involved in K+ transport